MMKCLFFLLPLLSLAFPFSLDGEWTLKTTDGSVQLKARIPCTVKGALLANNSIPHPYIAMNNEASQWVEEKTWIWEKQFDFKKREGKRYFLKIGGIAPGGEVSLNGKQIDKVEGMFAQPLVEVTDILRDGKNTIQIITKPERERTRAIACQMSYGWDFAPRIIPLGILRPISITENGPALIKDPFLKLKEIKGSIAEVELSLSIDSKVRGKGRVTISIKGENFKTKELEVVREVALSLGEQKKKFSLQIPDPKLWYPMGFGKQNLYRLDIRLLLGGQTSSQTSFLTGLRRLEWENNEGLKGGYPWILKVNGVRVYCKGANWVPVDALFSLSPDRYERLIDLAEMAGINMLRIWGGGIVEEDALYELCDRRGILLWQEFPLACADYPEIPRSAFLQNVQDAILRLRNHPSLVLWCGGNEFDPDNSSNKDLVDGMDKLCQSLDGTRPFHRASPYGGDVHDWSVWHGSAPYTNYRAFSFFRSEAGLQAPPPLEDIERFLSPEKIYPPSQEWEYHLANASKMRMYGEIYGSISGLEDFVKKSQLAQAITYQFNLDSCLKNMWRNSGCLIWQFNDPWPNFSWSMVDWYGNPKPSFYWFKSASHPVNVALDYDKPFYSQGDSINLTAYAINITPNPAKYKALLLIASPRKIIQEFAKEHTFAPQRSEKIWEVRFQVPRDYEEGVLFLVVRLLKGDEIVVEKTYPLPIARLVPLPSPLDALVILSQPGHEEEEWERLASLLEAFNINLKIATADSLPPLEGFQAIIIGESPNIGEKLKDKAGEINSAVARGAGLILDGGWNAYAEGKLNATALAETSPLYMQESSLRENVWLGIEAKEKEHPLLAGLPLSTVPVIRGYNEEKPKEDAKVILSLSNGTPLLVEGRYGEGICLAFTSGLRGGWASVQGWEAFPLFLARLIAYSAGRKAEELKWDKGGLNGLAKVPIKIEKMESQGKTLLLTLSNLSSQVAFFVDLKIKVEGHPFLPPQNYFTLLPHEKRTLKLSLPSPGKVEVEAHAF